MTFAIDTGDDDADQYAYGTNERDGCTCPAKAAGYNPNHEALTVANEYDAVLLDRHGTTHGVVDEDEARSAWFEMIERIRSGEATIAIPEEADLAERIARELGWLEDRTND